MANESQLWDVSFEYSVSSGWLQIVVTRSQFVGGYAPFRSKREVLQHASG